jgi:ABC-type antimicrobial peptide transport system permease subunit
LLIAANTVVMTVRERHTEIGVMRAIGFGPARICSMIVMESALLGLAGGALGCAATYALAKTLPVDVLPLGPMDLLAIVPPGVIAEAFALSIGIGVLAALAPGAASSRRSVVDVLRPIV